MKSAANTVNADASASPEKLHAHIVYVFDNNYAAIGGTSITSLFENNQDIDEITVYIMSDGFSEENRNKFAQLSNMYKRQIVFVDISQRVEEYKAMGFRSYRGSYIPYIKMFFPDYFPEIDKLVYIDADTVILRSIAPLFESDALLGMVKHSASSDSGSAGGYDAPFNSVILAYNAKRWREENWSAKATEWMKREDSVYLFADEGVLNTVCRNEIVKLPLGYAFDPIFLSVPKDDLIAVAKTMQYSPEEIAAAYDAPSIVHMQVFFGEKPWQLGTIHPSKAYFDEWLKKSPWKDYVRQPGKEPTFLYSAEKWMFQHLPRRLFCKIWILGQKYAILQGLKRFKEERMK